MNEDYWVAGKLISMESSDIPYGMTSKHKYYVCINNILIEEEEYRDKTYILEDSRPKFNAIILNNFMTSDAMFMFLDEYFNNSDLIMHTLNIGYKHNKLKVKSKVSYYKVAYRINMLIWSSVYAIYKDEETEDYLFITNTTEAGKVVLNYAQLKEYDKNIESHLQNDMKWIPMIDKDTLDNIVAKRSE